MPGGDLRGIAKAIAKAPRQSHRLHISGLFF
jgi:hypothetical protein